MLQTPIVGKLLNRACPVCASDSSSEIGTRTDGGFFRECDDCGLAYISPAPSSTQLAQYYLNYWDVSRPSLRVDQSRVLAESKAPRDWLILFGCQTWGGVPGSVADVGCGHGARLALMAALGAKRVAGCEIDESAAAFARGEHHLDVLHGDASVLIARGERFDVVLLSEVLEHVLEPVALLRQCRDLLDIGGLLVLSTPNAATRHRAKDRWVALTRDFDHLSGFSDRCLRSALADSGFDTLEVLPWGEPAPMSSPPRLVRWRERFRAFRRGPLLGPSVDSGHTLLCSARAR